MLHTTHNTYIVPYKVLLSNDDSLDVYPYIRTLNATNHKMYLVSPEHGRSYVVGRRSDRYVVSKGNGLSYTCHTFINTGELGNDTWGLLLKQDAFRDFIVGNEVRGLGIKTNHMEYVLELDTYITLNNGTHLKPILLQYSVECPYRISDSAYMTQDEINYWADMWHTMFPYNHKYRYQVAAEVLIKNLRTLEDNGILHNAMTCQNYTWALELLDFEIAHSPNYPYDSEDAQRHVIDLFTREIIFTYQIIISIAGRLREPVDYAWIDRMFNHYGYDIAIYGIKIQ